jgi:DNA polymerase/3'-5' exonuclease PolX
MNEKIIEQFKLLIKQIKFDIDNSVGKEQIKHTFRLSSIEKAVKILENFKNEIKDVTQLEGIEGIGKGTLDRIEEILETGKLNEVKIKDTKYLKGLEELSKIYGVGRKTAISLIKKYKVNNVEELKKKYDNGEITLPHDIELGLKYYGLLKEKIPRSEMDEINSFLCNMILNIDPQLFGVICGSYRRLNPTSNDVDFIIIHPENKNMLETLIKKLKEKNFIVDSLTSDDVKTKYMGLFKWNDIIRRIDVRFIPYESYYTSILYFTGNKDFNKRMRGIAKKKNYTLNEYELYHNTDKKRIKIKSEKDVFDILGMEYLTPDQRTK